MQESSFSPSWIHSASYMGSNIWIPTQWQFGWMFLSKLERKRSFSNYSTRTVYCTSTRKLVLWYSRLVLRPHFEKRGLILQEVPFYFGTLCVETQQTVLQLFQCCRLCPHVLRVKRWEGLERKRETFFQLKYEGVFLSEQHRDGTLSESSPPPPLVASTHSACSWC